MKVLKAGILLFSVALLSCNKEEKVKKDLDQILIKDSLEVYKKLYDEAAYFSIEKNENAQKKFAPQKIEVVMTKVVQDFTTLNKQTNGNPLLPKDVLGNTCKVNKMSVINNQWFLVDFYGEETAGEVLIKYTYQSDALTRFEVLDTVLY